MRYKFQWFLVIFLKIHFSLTDNNSEDYALLAQRRMHYDINMSEIQVSFVNDRHDDMIDVILDRQQMVQQEIRETNEQLTLLQTISSTYRTCIQKYRPRMYTKEQTQEKFNACLSASEIKYQKLLQDVETPLNYAKNTANVQLPMSIEDCQEFSNNGTLQDECVVDKVEAHSETFDEDLNSVQDKLEVNLGLRSLVIRNAMECSFDTEKHVLVKIGGSLQLIDLCLAGYQLPSISETILHN